MAKQSTQSPEAVKVKNLSEVRESFASAIYESQSGPVVIQKHGRPTAVLVGIDRSITLVNLIAKLVELRFVTEKSEVAALAGIGHLRKISEVLAESRRKTNLRRGKGPLKSHAEVMGILKRG